MSEPEREPQPDLLGGLVRDLERRHRVDDAPARRALDEQVAEVADQVSQLLQPELRTDAPREPLPRRVAVAFALALLSSPHFVATLTAPARDGTLSLTEPPRPSPPALPPIGDEVYERALGLAQWEVDELREEIDRRAGRVLKQVRTVNWLWSFFGLPTEAATQTLTRILFPGSDDASVDVVRRGGQIYLVVDAQSWPLHALFLPWLAPDADLGPSAFHSRGVDRGLRSRLSRGVGADDDEVSELLEEIVTIVPRRAAHLSLRTDQWRQYGYASVTDLGTPYTAGAWLTKPIPPDALDWRAWLKIGPAGQLGVRGSPDKVFDALALPRVTAMVRQLYGAMFASVASDASGPAGRPLQGVGVEDVDLLDVPRHLRATLEPLLAWPGRSATHKFVAKELSRPVEEVSYVLERIQQVWTEHAAQSWFGRPGPKTPSIQTLLLEHVLVLHQSLRRTAATEPDPRGDHQDVLMLFTAHYLREARLERLWVKSLSDCAVPESKTPPPEDIVSSWFWRAWARVLNELDPDARSAP